MKYELYTKYKIKLFNVNLYRQNNDIYYKIFLVT